MSETLSLPKIKTVSPATPILWLMKAWVYYRAAFWPCFVYGLVLFAISAGLALALYVTETLPLFLVLAGGFLFIAPMLAMGIYQAARMLERRERPQVKDMLWVRSAFRRDLVLLGLALLLLFSLWIEAAYLTYGLSTHRMHNSVSAFLEFMFLTPEGRQMALIGSVIGGFIAFLAFTLVVVSAPMLLDEETDIFIATITSVRAVTHNFLPMLVWAALIAMLTFFGIATAFLGLIFVFPLIGLASWHAYRDLVEPV